MTRTHLRQAVALALSLGSAALLAQPVALQHHQFYVDREKTAPPDVKQLLVTQRKLIAERKLKFTVGFTYALERKLADITGGMKNTDATVVTKQAAISSKLLALNKSALADALKVNPALRAKIPILRLAPRPTDATLDYRKVGMVTPVKRQLAGTCWAYAAVAALESSSLLLNNQSVDASEHYVITNDFADYAVPGNFNGGGWCFKAVNFLVNQGTVADTTDPDNGLAGTPNPGVFKPYGGLTWGFCHGTYGSATVAEIKQALCEHGPVGTWIDAGGTFGGYTGGVYNDTNTTHQVGGHFVLIIGWDEAKGAWLIKNSWGTNWGDTCGYGTERGYAWVGYGIHGIQSDAVWIQAHPALYQINLEAIKKIMGPAHFSLIRR
jgi:cathepsin L